MTMKPSELNVLIRHTSTVLANHAEHNDSSHRLEETVEDLVKYISLRWPQEAGFLYSGFDEARERHRAEQRKRSPNVARLASTRMMEPDHG